jgi:glutaminase
MARKADGAAEPRYVSTGTLPPAELVEALVAEAHTRFAGVFDGANSTVYPALESVPSDRFGVCVVGTSGSVYSAGDADVSFAIMSISKPFVFALVCQEVGPDRVRDLVGVNGTGLPFNSLAAVERSGDGRTNPMVNPGAIATTSLVAGTTRDERWDVVLDGLSRFAGRPLELDAEVYECASETNHRNRTLADLLQSYERIYDDPQETLDRYTRQCSVSVTARDLAVMGATVADGGVNPLTGERVVDEATCRHTLAAMTTAGLYETSGDWLYDVGLPGKSGIGGGIVTVSPGKGGLGTFAPPLDEAGNSVRGQLAARFLSRRLGLDLFSSAPEGPPR